MISVEQDEEVNDGAKRIHVHCSTCFNINNCKYKNGPPPTTDICNQTKSYCKLVECSNKCGFRLHECKLVEHKENLCANEYVNCINKTNGCKLKMRRVELGAHLSTCVASVVRCGSFRIRTLINKNEKYTKLKWPDPIYTERLNHQNLDSIDSSSSSTTPQAATATATTTTAVAESNNNINCAQLKNINDILLEQDYKSLKRFALESPLRFHRLYGYLIGLDVAKDYSQSRFSFMQILLKNVKSKIFKDLEAENCIVFNDEEGCTACQARIRNMESNRFKDMKQHRSCFYFVLSQVDNYDEFLEQKIYLKPEFIRTYREIYLKPKEEEDLERRQRDEEALTLTSDEINAKLVENNNEILNLIELNSILRLNVAKELPCEAFQASYESYRLKETTFSCDCDLLLRRDEYSDHYFLFHNFLLSNAEHIDLNCPLKDYGCQFYQQKIDFIYGNVGFRKDNNRYVNMNHPLASLVNNSLTNSLSFRLDYLNLLPNYDKNNNNDYLKNTSGSNGTTSSSIKNSNTNTNSSSGSSGISNKSFMDLPFEVLFEIIDHLDSLSLYCLSMTCKDLRNVCEKFLQLRGIVYPKWRKVKIEVNSKKPDEENDNDGNGGERRKRDLNKFKWQIDSYAFTFSKHIERPTTIKLKTNILNDLYAQHIQNCPYKTVKKLTEKFRIYPPFN